MDRELLVTLAADIVAAQVSNNNVAIGDMAKLVENVHRALTGLGEPQQPQEAERKVPVVSIKASVKPDYIVCMECGRKQKTLRRHLQTAHGMTPDQYRQDYGLPASYPLTAPNYSERRREMAKTIGLGRKKGETVKARPGAGAKGAGRGRGRKGGATAS